MKKLIAKTIFLSAFLFVALSLGIIGILNASMPLKMADFYQSIGMMETSVKTCDIVYKNSSDITKQFFMFNKALNANSFELVKKYSDKLLNNPNLDEFVLYLNSLNANNPYLQNEKNRIYKNYVKSIYQTKHTQTAKQIAFDLLETSAANETFCFAIDALPKSYIFSQNEKDALENKYQELYNYFKQDTTKGINEAVVAVRLSEMLEVLFRFTNKTQYQNDFLVIKALLESFGGSSVTK